MFVDEVHERSLESDFLLMVLRDLMRRRFDDPTCPKIVLMSATLDAELFNRYFEGAPSVKFPGRAFPVTDRACPSPHARTCPWACSVHVHVVPCAMCASPVHGH